MKSLDADLFRAILHSQLTSEDGRIIEQKARNAAKVIRTTLKKASIPKLPDMEAEEQLKLNTHLKELETDGITLLGPVLNKQQVEDIRSYLSNKNAYGGHVWTFSDKTPKNLSDLRKTNRQACHILEDTLNSPHLLELISDTKILKLAESYLGCTPTVFQSNLMWSFSNDIPGEVAQAFHRDYDNYKFCVLFVYLTDVDKDTGAHQYIKKSHKFSLVEEIISKQKSARSKSITPEMFFDTKQGLGINYIDEVFGNNLLQIEKPAGYAFLADAYGLHRGLPLKKGERLLFWTRFGIYDNGYSIDATPKLLSNSIFGTRIKNDATHRYIFRSIIESEFSSFPNFPLYTPPELLEPEISSEKTLSSAKKNWFKKLISKKTCIL